VCVVGAYSPGDSRSAHAGTGANVCNTPIGGGRCGFAVEYGGGACESPPPPFPCVLVDNNYFSIPEHITPLMA
jgi:hypothetical protein